MVRLPAQTLKRLMSTTSLFSQRLSACVAAIALMFGLFVSLQARVLDDFNDNTKTGWTDFKATDQLPIPDVVEQNQQFVFDIPSALVDLTPDGLYTASVKTTEEFTLADGRTVEFRVDLVQGAGNDDFAVLAFVPKGIDPKQTLGYSFAKSANEILLVKALNHYFLDDDTPTGTVKHSNVTMVMSLTGQGGNVIIDAKVLDKDADNAVLWERTVTDTPGADFGNEGELGPAQSPFLSAGNFALYMYAIKRSPLQDPFHVVYDNAVVAAPPAAANQTPIVNVLAPAASASFLPTSTTVSFQALDDAPLADSGLSITLNGTRYTTANGLALSGPTTNRVASLSGVLATNVDYVAAFAVEDAGGLSTTTTRYFDTFLTSDRMIEIEDYDFDGGSYINNPVPISEGASSPTSYSWQTGLVDTDYSDTRTFPDPASTLYRPNDNVRMQHTLDVPRQKYLDAGGTGALVFDYDVGDVAAGEWLNFTRDFAAGSYEVYLREGLLLMDNGRCELQRVTAQNTNVLGSFLGRTTGNNYRNFALTDGAGLNKIILRLSGRTTLRLQQVTPDPGDGAQYQNYLIFLPVADPGIQRATVSAVSPPNASVYQSAFLTISATILNRDTSVNPSTVRMQLNGQQVPAIVTPTTDGASVSYVVPGVTPAGVPQNARVTFDDNLGVGITNDWSFTLTYLQLDPANGRAGTGTDAGFFVRAVQAPQGTDRIDSVDQAEKQLALQLPNAPFVDTSVVQPVLNMSHDGSDAGYFVAPGHQDLPVPGLDAAMNGTEDFTVEMKAYLHLDAGAYRIGVRTDDGFKMTSGDSLDNKTAVLALNNGTSDLTIDLVAPVAGLYPFRLIWYNRGGPGNGEWFSVDPTTSTRTLINDTASSVKAYRTVVAPSVVLQSAPDLSATTNWQDDNSANVNAGTKTITTAQSGVQRFYRLESGSALRIKTIQVSGGIVTLTYE
jgi:hypothetical protein